MDFENWKDYAISFLAVLVVIMGFMINSRDVDIQELNELVESQSSTIERKTDTIAGCREIIEEAEETISTAASEIEYLQTRYGRSYYDFVEDIDAMTTPELPTGYGCSDN